VKFGGGLLGHLDAGGHFYVKQEEVQPGYWELTVLDVDMKGKALFFKTIGVQEEMKRSVFRRVRDDLTAAQGANLLYQQVPATGKISSERHSTEVFDQQAPPLPNIAKPVGTPRFGRIRQTGWQSVFASWALRITFVSFHSLGGLETQTRVSPS
jgi:hypothetical protein